VAKPVSNKCIGDSLFGILGDVLKFGSLTWLLEICLHPFRQSTSGMCGKEFSSGVRAMMTTPINQNLRVLGNYHEFGDYYEWVLVAYLGKHLTTNHV